MEDNYKILQITNTATQEEIKNAYENKRIEAIQNNDGFLEIRLKDAYEEINTLKKKKKYDRKISTQKTKEKIITTIKLNTKKTETKPNINNETNKEMIDHKIAVVNETHNDWKPKKGDLSSILIKVSYLEAMRGCEQTVDLKTTKICSECKNTQNTNSDYMYPCEDCSGEGYLVSKKETINDTEYVTIVNCDICKNTGFKRNCSNCNNSGFVSKIEPVKIKIPKGTISGESFKVLWGGKVGENGGAIGDLLVNVKTSELKLFRIDEDRNMYLDLHLTTNDLMNFSSFEIPSIDGFISLNVSKNWNSSVPHIRKKNCGGYIKNTTKRGDLIVKIIVHLDVKESDEPSKMYLDFIEKCENI